MTSDFVSLVKTYFLLQAEKFKKEKPTQEHCRLLTLELVFLWHALPTCSPEDLKPLLNGIAEKFCIVSL
jgi:hypothetical protein